MVGIYKIENLVNHKVYIGQSKNIERRWGSHRTRPFQENGRDYNSYFYRSIRKYGLNNFSFSVIEECSQDELNDKEIYWIKYYNANNPEKGYNLTAGGSSAVTKTILTKEEVLEIYEKLKQPISMAEIAEDYNVTYHTISDINSGDTWFCEEYSYPIREKYFFSKLTKNKTFKEDNFCVDCGVKITSRATRCKKCQGKSLHQTKISREELKELIRTKPFTTIGEMFNVSDNAIRKWCKGFDLPYKKTEIKKYTDEEWEAI